MSNAKNPNVWIIKAGSQAEIAQDFQSKGVVAVGWPDLEDFPVTKDRLSFRREIKKRLPKDFSEQRVGAAAGQLWTFINVIKQSDIIITPVKRTRQVLVGVMKGEYQYKPEFNEDYPRIRKVDWIGSVGWDSVPTPQRNSFFAWQAIHQPHEDFSLVVRLAENPGALQPESASQRVRDTSTGVDKEQEDLAEKAEDAIRIHLQRISYDEFPNVVGAVLRAAGFTVLYNSSGRGKDAGIDLIISRDPFGAGERIIVQVKHRKGAATQQELQQLVGTLKQNEFGLMISTGGITSDAVRFWRDHRDKLLKPLEASDFIQLLGNVYDKLDSEYKAMLPLKKLYVPAAPEE